MSDARRTSVVRLVAAREIAERARTKAFRLTLVVLALGAVATALLSNVARGEGGRTVQVAVVAADAGAVREALDAATAGAKVHAIVRELPAEADVVAAVRSGDAVVGVVPGALVWRHEVDAGVAPYVTAAVDAVARRARAEALGVSPAQLDALRAPVPLVAQVLEPRARDRSVRIATASIGSVVLYLSIQISASLLMSGLITEKSTRVVEVLLNHIRPRELLAGKVLGIGAVGLAQILVTAVAASATLLLTRDVSLPKVPVDAIAWLVVWFVLGYGIHAALFAMAASLVSRQEDASAVTMPVMLPLVASYFLSFAAVEDADGMLARVLAIVPFSAPLVMPIRIAAGDPSPAAMAASVVLAAGTVVLLLRLAGRLYGHTLLRTGARVSWAEAAGAVLGRGRA